MSRERDPFGRLGPSKRLQVEIDLPRRELHRLAADPAPLIPEICAFATTGADRNPMKTGI